MGFSVRRFGSSRKKESLLHKQRFSDLQKEKKSNPKLQQEEQKKKVVEEEEEEEETWSSILDINLEEEDPYKELEVIIQEKKQQPIFKLPSSLKMVNVKAYEPQVVSIGPYHNGKPHLMPMEIHKKRALVHFVKRSGVPLQTYITELMKVVDELKLSYAQLNQEWIHDDQKFVELMIVDGFFLLEFFAVGTKVSIDDYARSDPMFSFHGKTVNYDSTIKDLLTVENQLPYLVLTTLLSVARPQEDAHETISHMMLSQRSIQFGIRFKKVSGYKNIRFDYKQAVLLLPPVMIHDDHQNPFLNMRAFEVWVSKDLKFHSFNIRPTSYIGMFNVDSEPIVALNDMNEYCKQGTVVVWRMCRIWISNLYENYFSNPWDYYLPSGSSFSHGTNHGQTYYTIISYKSG
ncbi:hypothetical protein MKW98_018315 [Papaver atlanticum]|uniref:Uncharacterized protein n=1 Tax=Papaver atlanticum TaxID=357466 RepID=A0AAD4T7M0_9MAGN|nr:hypothetical protein MKW98_018315 [Papaver atlanticum]